LLPPRSPETERPEFTDVAWNQLFNLHQLTAVRRAISAGRRPVGLGAFDASGTIDGPAIGEMIHWIVPR
jgi:hypothetical protein